MKDKFEQWLLHDDEASTFFNTDFDKVTGDYCNDQVQNMYVAYCAGQEELRSLKAENESLRKDAENYRLIKSQHESNGDFCVAELGQGDWRLIEELVGMDVGFPDLDAALEKYKAMGELK